MPSSRKSSPVQLLFDFMTQPTGPQSSPQSPSSAPSSSATRSAPSSSTTRNASGKRRISGEHLVSLWVRVNDGGRTIGEDHVGAKYLDEDVEHARELRAAGFTWKDISERLDMPVRTVRDYCSGRRRCESVAGFRKIKRIIRG